MQTKLSCYTENDCFIKYLHIEVLCTMLSCLCIWYVIVGVSWYLPHPCHSSDSRRAVQSPLSCTLHASPHFTLPITALFFYWCQNLSLGVRYVTILWSVSWCLCVKLCIFAALTYRTSSASQRSWPSPFYMTGTQQRNLYNFSNRLHKRFRAFLGMWWGKISSLCNNIHKPLIMKEHEHSKHVQAWYFKPGSWYHSVEDNLNSD